jgi:transcriptional regulator with XRE-family HTH domain
VSGRVTNHDKAAKHVVSCGTDENYLELVRLLLESNDVTQTELAHRSEIAESTISEILAGKRKLSRRHIAAFARIIRVSPAIFFHPRITAASSLATAALNAILNADRAPTTRTVTVLAAGGTSCVLSCFELWIIGFGLTRKKEPSSCGTSGSRSPG